MGAGDLGQRRQQQVADAVALKPFTHRKPVGEQPAQHGALLGVPGQCYQALSDVAGGQLTEFVAQTPGTPAAVAHRDNRRQVKVMVFEARENTEVPGPTSDHDDRRIHTHLPFLS